MKKFFKALNILPIFFSFSFTNAPINKAKDFSQGKFYDSNIKLDFTDSTIEDINSYYGSVGTMTGDEMKLYLYSKIATHKADTSEGQKYFLTYSQVTSWYKLTDRNWTISASVTPETFNLNKDNTYYFYNAYISDSANNDVTKAYSNYINSGFKTDASLDHIDYENKKKPSSMIQVDKEHMWAKNHGFKMKDSAGKDVETKGAWTDLHHLVAADHNTNSEGHNDYFFGEVDHDKATVIKNYLADGTQEISGWLDKANETFEPTDEWKGDVARCLLYMGTRYSFKLDKNTQEEPYLYLTDDKTYQDDDANRDYSDRIFHGVQYNLSTLLSWNEKDPVSDYEIHRNNLIYKNIQDNRNPFIDHPEWARRVYDVNYVYDASKEQDPTIHANKNNTDNKDSSSSQDNNNNNNNNSSSNTNDNTNNNDNNNTDNHDFSLFGLTPKQTYILIIAVLAILLILIIVIIAILVNKANKKQKAKAKKMIKKAAKTTYKKYDKNKKK